MNLNILAKEAYDTARKRNQPQKDAFKHLLCEVLEAQEAYAKYIVACERDCTTTQELQKWGEDLSLELADVIICACSIAEQAQVDINTGVKNKHRINALRAKNGR